MEHNRETKSEIFAQRLVVAVIWNICLQVCLAVGLVFIMQLDILHPINWIISTCHDIFGIKMAFNIILLVLVSVFQAILYGRYHLIPPPKHFTRFSLFVNIFTLQNILFCVLYSLSGYFTIGLYSSLAKSSFYGLQKPCQKYDGRCLVEESLFLQMGGMWIGLFYFITRNIYGTNMLVFPNVNQDKYQQIKRDIGDIVIMGFQNAITPVVYFSIFYTMWNKPRSVISEIYSLYLEDPPLSNILTLLQSGILLRIWFYASLFLISVSIMRNIFNIVLTEPMIFPVQSESRLPLHIALGQKAKFNAVLAAQDLRILSMTEPHRRLQIFTLSQPGGHPKNWNNILEKCLRIIDEFSKDLDSINSESKHENLSPTKPALDNVPTYSALRNMAQSPELDKISDYRNQQTTFADSVNDMVSQILQNLCQKPGFNYFFGELTDTKLKFLLIRAQPVIWTCEGLAHLAGASLKEDKYGIVQNDLPVIISTLVKLKVNLDKIAKPGLVPRKQILNDPLAIKMNSALMSAVKRSLYKIIITFAKYINDIPLHPDVQLAIQPFLLFKEA